MGRENGDGEGPHRVTKRCPRSKSMGHTVGFSNYIRESTKIKIQECQIDICNN
jgi:hypothetical protein